MIEATRTGPVGLFLPVPFYSGWNDNRNVSIHHPGEKEPAT
jgi:hypothetical protein